MRSWQIFTEGKNLPSRNLVKWAFTSRGMEKYKPFPTTKSATIRTSLTPGTLFSRRPRRTTLPCHAFASRRRRDEDLCQRSRSEDERRGSGDLRDRVLLRYRDMGPERVRASGPEERTGDRSGVSAHVLRDAQG